jgi:hypothetical protein
MSVRYFIYNERFSNPIIKSQVINLLDDYLTENEGSEVTLCIYQNPIVYILEAFVRKKTLENRLQKHLKVRVFPFALPTRGVFLSEIGICLHRIVFRLFQRNLSGGTVVARGYVAGVLASDLVDRGKIKHLVFDPRSLFVRENINVRWTESSSRHKFWESVERQIVAKSDLVIAVNNAMVAYYKGLSPGCQVALVPIYTRSNNCLKNDKNRVSNRLRLLYIGSLGENLWNNVVPYLKFVEQLAQYRDQVELIFIVKSYSKSSRLLEDSLQRLRLQAEVLYSIPHQQALEIAQSADIGLTLGDCWEDASARTGIKTLEYLSSGLAVWTTRQLVEVAGLVDQNDIGFVFSSSKPLATEISTAIATAEKKRNGSRSAVHKLYQSSFSSSVVFRHYQRIFSGSSILPVGRGGLTSGG